MAYTVKGGGNKSYAGGGGVATNQNSRNQSAGQEEAYGYEILEDNSNFRGQDSKYGESPVIVSTQRRYPGGKIIPPSLPDSYEDGRGKSYPLGLERRCSNCYFNKNGYCSNFDASIREDWVCKSWGEPSTNENLILLEKQAYGSKRVKDEVETEFSELTQNNKKDLETFFNLYNSLFFDIPKDGSESHESLMKRSREYLNNYIDPKDATIEALQDEIEHLNGTLLNNSMKGAAVSNNLNQFDSIDKITIPKIELNEPDGTDDLDPEDRDNWPTVGERVTPTPVGSDENNDGIDDSTQTLSNYGTVMLYAPGSGNTSFWLAKPNHWYYKPEYYGKPIYCFTRKLPHPSKNNPTTNLIVVNLGPQGQPKYRTLKVVGHMEGPEYRILKKHWTDSNSYPSGRSTGAAGYLLEPL